MDAAEADQPGCGPKGPCLHLKPIFFFDSDVQVFNDISDIDLSRQDLGSRPVHSAAVSEID